MARKSRIVIAGGLYYVLLRGNGKDALITDKEDYAYFHALAQEGIERFGHRIHAFCCLPEGIHLAVQIADIGLPRVIQNLTFRYTRWINDRRRRSGPLFHGRYKALLVDDNKFLLDLVRFIHLTPCRSGAAKDPARYPWSTHKTYIGKDALSWVTTERVLERFSKNRPTAIRRYTAYIAEGLQSSKPDPIQGGMHDSRIVGDARFHKQIVKRQTAKTRKPPTITRIVQAVCKEYEVKERELADPGRQRRLAEARGIVAWLVVKHGSGTLTELAQRFNRDLSAMSLAARAIEAKCKTVKTLHSTVQRLSKTLGQG